MRRRMGVLAVAVVSALSLAASASAQEDRFQAANQLYQASDFSGAVEAYRTILDSGFESGPLYYNLGNAYFKTGAFGKAILNYERALRLDPRDRDAQANLDLARSLTADAFEPLPRFWVLSILDWWTNLFSRWFLALLVALSWVAVAAGLCTHILSSREKIHRLGIWMGAGGGAALFLFGLTLLARDGDLARTEWGIIMTEEVAVQSAPSGEDDLTLFHIHEGTKVRLDQQTDAWSEVVVEDGRVGWVPSGSLEKI